MEYEDSSDDDFRDDKKYTNPSNIIMYKKNKKIRYDPWECLSQLVDDYVIRTTAHLDGFDHIAYKNFIYKDINDD